MQQIVSRALFLLSVIVILVIVVRLTAFFGATPFKETYDAEQFDALIAMARADTIGEDVKNRCLAQELVVDYALRRREKHPGLKFTQMLQTADGIYPDGWKHKDTFKGRSVKAIY